MLRRLALFVLAQVGQAPRGAEPDARRRAYAAVDPLLRGAVRARVARVVAATSLESDHADDEPHVHRAALLALAGRQAERADDPESVRAAFDAALAAGVGARPRLGHAAGRLGCAGLALALAALAAGAALGPRVWGAQPREAAPPASAGAYREGGRPLPGSPAVRAVFTERIPAAVVAIGRIGGGDAGDEDGRGVGGAQGGAMHAARDRALAARDSAVAAARAELGPEVGERLARVLDRAIEAASGAGLAALEDYDRDLDLLDAAIAARGLGYYVDGTARADARGRTFVYLGSYEVELVAPYRSGPARLTALRLRRVDRLNFEWGYLGFTREGLQHALVLVERVEAWLVRTVLPALGDARGAGAMPLTDLRSSALDWARAAGARGGECARAWALAELGDAALVARVGNSFARRRALFAELGERLASRGGRLAEPETFEVDLGGYRALERLAMPHELRELDAIGEGLAEPAVRRAVETLHEAALRSVERHEVQHRLDQLEGERPVPGTVARYAGRPAPGRPPSPLAARVTAETSAYLGEIARGGRMARTTLAVLVAHALDDREAGGVYCLTALAVLDALGDALALPVDALVVGRAVDREAVAARFLAITERDDDAVAGAAARAFEATFGRPLPALERATLRER